MGHIAQFHIHKRIYCKFKEQNMFMSLTVHTHITHHFAPNIILQKLV